MTTETTMTLRQRAFAELKKMQDAMREQELQQRQDYRRSMEGWLRQAMSERLGCPVSRTPITWRKVTSDQGLPIESCYDMGFPTLLVDDLTFAYLTNPHCIHLVAIQENGDLEDQGRVDNLIELAERIQNMKEDPFASE
jgi:hypothetical protein